MEKTNHWNQQITPKISENNDITDMSLVQKEDVGKLLVRLSVGGLMLIHGMTKIIQGNEQVSQILTDVGIPNFFSFGVFIGEVLGPILIIVGYMTRVGAFFVALNMLIAILLVHASQLDEISASGGWMVELNALYLLGAVAIILLGSGRIAITKGKGALD